MNPAALLALISELYEQMTIKQQRIDELEAQVAGPPPNGDGKQAQQPRPDFATTVGRTD